MTITITPLAETELPALDQGMANATLGPRRGYRFGPHNTKFGDKITVSLPYDPALIPEGLTADDLRTFFFDDQLGRWQELDRVKVDTKNRLVRSMRHLRLEMSHRRVRSRRGRKHQNVHQPRSVRPHG